MTTARSRLPDSRVDLYWLPLGAGGHSVRWNGRIYESISAALARRPRRDLYHSALELHTPTGRFVIEQTPVPPGDPTQRGAVVQGPVGARWAGRCRLFRYEVRCWRNGLIPDIEEAVESPRSLSSDPSQAERLLALVPHVPTPTWGRDELRTGEMWNSNSIISWLITRSGLDPRAVKPPRNGRAPGWHAGITVALSEYPHSVTRSRDTHRCH